MKCKEHDICPPDCKSLDEDRFMYPEEFEDKIRAIKHIVTDNADPGLSLSLLAVAMGRIIWDLKGDIYTMQRIIDNMALQMASPLCKEVPTRKVPRKLENSYKPETLDPTKPKGLN